MNPRGPDSKQEQDATFLRLIELEAQYDWGTKAADLALGSRQEPLIPRSAFKGKEEVCNWLRVLGGWNSQRRPMAHS